jgi:cyclopropane fatty-acyl-phospholipid synthase-like methyltransferase
MTCLEVGVLPGDVLLFFGLEHGYSCYGIDYLAQVEKLTREFSDQGLDAKFYHSDFLKWETDQMFDFVYSFGFVEHFNNYREVINKHWGLVKSDGFLLIAIPTLTLFQKIIRWICYEKWKLQEIYKTHNLEIMSLKKLHKEVMNLPKSEIFLSTYASEMDVWFNETDLGVRPWTSPLFKPLRILEGWFRRLGLSSSIFSPWILVLAKKHP